MPQMRAAWATRAKTTPLCPSTHCMAASTWRFPLHTPFSMGTGIVSTAAMEASEEHHAVTAKWATPSMTGKNALSFTKPTSANERPMLRR